jgi:hypothetical protein
MRSSKVSTVAKSILLERVQFRDGVALPCTDGVAPSALAWRDDRPAHVLELDVGTRIVSVCASEAMRNFRGITSADRDHVVEVPLENVAYMRRLSEKTRRLIEAADEKRTRLDAAREAMTPGDAA